MLRYGLSGQSGRATPAKSPEVKAYPKLNSKQPLYGVVVFGMNRMDRPGAGPAKYHFVLDESGEAAKAATTKEGAGKEGAAKEGTAKEGTKSLLKSLSDAVTEQKAKSPPGPKPEMSAYDRLYFDANADLDLTNDPVLKPIKDPPTFFSMGSNSRAFEVARIRLSLAPEPGTCEFSVLPMAQFAGRDGYVTFLLATVRKANLRLGKQDYVALLSPMGIGRFDRPMNTRLQLTPAAEAGKARLTTGYEYLGVMRLVDGQYYTFSTTPSGDELRFGPYRGDLGVLEVGPGGRAITDLGVVGLLRSQDTFVPLGDFGPVPPANFPRRHMVPVGDYTPMSLNVQYGRLRFAVRMMSEPVRQPLGGTPKPPEPVLKIRKDKPVVLEFSGKPEVKFLSPAKGQSIKPGDTVRIAAMLTEPWQGVMITGLSDTTKKTGERKFRLGDQDVTIPQYVTLNPTIVIKNAKGEKVAEGTMPFG